MTESPEDLRTKYGERFRQKLIRDQEKIKFRPLGSDAFHGLIGDVVRQTAPYTEAGEEAVCLSFLSILSFAVGSGARIRVGSSSGLLIHGILSGDTANGRKGTSTDLGLSILKRAGLKAAAFSGDDKITVPLETRILRGVSTPEGILDRIRDGNPECADGSCSDEDIIRMGPETEHIHDLGSPEKRLLIVLEEMASLLEKGKRQGNDIIAFLRLLWDGPDSVDSPTRHSPLCATRPHVGALFNTTPYEMRKKMSITDIKGGSLNRNTVAYAYRSKFLPMPLHDEEQEALEGTLSALGERLREAVSWARGGNPGTDMDRYFSLDDEAYLKWIDLYGRWSLGETSPSEEGVRDATTRYTSQILRVAALYALCDQTQVVSLTHLKAAEAVMDHVLWATGNVFAVTEDDEDVTKVRGMLDAADGDWVTRSDVSKHCFQHHKPAKELNKVIDVVLTSGYYEKGSQKSANGGRPAVVYRRKK